jgi:tetratricopeptide (TPR) repeat protein
MIAGRLSVLLAVVLGAGRLAGLDIGEPVPALSGATWVKDVPAKLTGTFSIIEFWSTKAPSDSFAHLSEIQHAQRERVQVIGVSSEAAEVVKPFVEDQGGEMDYHVAVIDAAAAAVWLPDKEDLPRVLIVDRDGRLAWRGDPGDFESILDRLLTGSVTTALLARLAPLEARVDALIDGEHADPKASKEQALELTQRLLSLDPINLKTIGTRMWLAQQLQRPEIAALTLAGVPVARLDAADANALAMERLNELDPAYRFPDLTYALARRAREAAPDVAIYRDTFARFLHQAGLLEEAVAEQKRAVGLDPADDGLVAMLEYYQALQGLRTQLADDLAHAPPETARPAGAGTAGASAPPPAGTPAPSTFIP